MALADARTLEALDFAAVRDRVVAATRTHRGRAYARELLPQDDFDVVRHEQLRTEAVRSLIAGSISASCRRSRPRRSPRPRSWGGRSAAAIFARSATRLLLRPRPIAPSREHTRSARRRCRLYAAARADACDRRCDRRTRQCARSGVAGAWAHPAQPSASASRRARSRRLDSELAKVRESDSRPDRHDSQRALRHPDQSRVLRGVPSIVHDTSASGQTLFVEPLAALETNNRVRTLQIEEEREIAAHSRGAFARRRHARRPISKRTSKCSRGSTCSPRRPSSPAESTSVAPELSDDPVLGDRARTPSVARRRAPSRNRSQSTTRRGCSSSAVRTWAAKTVALKMVGLFVVMTYCGMQLPAGTRARRPLRARRGRHRRRTIARRERLDLFRAPCSGCARCSTVRMRGRWRSWTKSAAAPSRAPARRSRSRCWSDCSRRGARAIVSTHSVELKLFAHATAGRRERERALRSEHASRRPSSSTSGRRDSRWHFRSRRGWASIRRSSSARRTLLERRERDYEAALCRARAAQQRAARGALADWNASAASVAASSRRGEPRARRARGGTAAPSARAPRNGCSRACATLRASWRSASETRRRPSCSAQTHRSDAPRPRNSPDEAARTEAARHTSPGDRVRILSLNQEGIVAEDWDERLLVSRRFNEDDGGEERRSPRTSAVQARRRGDGAGRGDARHERGAAFVGGARRSRQALRRGRTDRRTMDRRRAACRELAAALDSRQREPGCSGAALQEYSARTCRRQEPALRQRRRRFDRRHDDRAADVSVARARAICSTVSITSRPSADFAERLALGASAARQARHRSDESRSAPRVYGRARIRSSGSPKRAIASR